MVLGLQLSSSILDSIWNNVEFVPIGSKNASITSFAEQQIPSGEDEERMRDLYDSYYSSGNYGGANAQGSYGSDSYSGGTASSSSNSIMNASNGPLSANSNDVPNGNGRYGSQRGSYVENPSRPSRYENPNPFARVGRPKNFPMQMPANRGPPPRIPTSNMNDEAFFQSSDETSLESKEEPTFRQFLSSGDNGSLEDPINSNEVWKDFAPIVKLLKKGEPIDEMALIENGAMPAIRAVEEARQHGMVDAALQDTLGQAVLFETLKSTVGKVLERIPDVTAQDRQELLAALEPPKHIPTPFRTSAGASAGTVDFGLESENQSGVIDGPRKPIDRKVVSQFYDIGNLQFDDSSTKASRNGKRPKVSVKTTFAEANQKPSAVDAPQGTSPAADKKEDASGLTASVAGSVKGVGAAVGSSVSSVTETLGLSGGGEKKPEDDLTKSDKEKQILKDMDKAIKEDITDMEKQHTDSEEEAVRLAQKSDTWVDLEAKPEGKHFAETEMARTNKVWNGIKNVINDLKGMRDDARDVWPNPGNLDTQMLARSVGSRLAYTGFSVGLACKRYSEVRSMMQAIEFTCNAIERGYLDHIPQGLIRKHKVRGCGAHVYESRECVGPSDRLACSAFGKLSKWVDNLVLQVCNGKYEMTLDKKKDSYVLKSPPDMPPLSSFFDRPPEEIDAAQAQEDVEEILHTQAKIDNNNNFQEPSKA